MAQIGTLELTGATGKKYLFNVYPVHQKFTSGAGIYCISREWTGSDGNLYHTLIYIGMTGDICNRFADHHKDKCFTYHSANRICVHADSTDQGRRAKEMDLIDGNHLLCNG